MANNNSTKKALIFSTLTIFICVSMLIGTTFAWFTDSTTASVNTIQSSKLDVELEMKEGENWVSAEGKTLSFTTEKGETENVLWEPGCKYSLPELRVVNKGNIALKFKILITGIKGDAKLNEAIDWTINGLNINTEYELAVEAISNVLTISGTMDTDAGNEYQGLTIENISITVVATQINENADYNQKELTWPNINDVHENTVIDGEGRMNVEDYQEIGLVESADITIKGVIFSNGLAIYTAAGVEGTITLENCTIYLKDAADYPQFGMDFADYGLYIGAVSENVTWIFKNCTFKAHDNHEYTNTTNSYNVYIAGNYNAKSITFDGCEFSGAGKHGIGCSSDGSSTYYDFTVTNCSFLNWNNNNKFTNGAAIRGNVTSSALENITIKIENNTFGLNNGSTQKNVAIDGWNEAWN